MPYTGGKMRAFTTIIGLTSILTICAVSLAVAGDIEHQYGIEFRGGYGLYMNNVDPDSYVEKFEGITATGYSQKEFTESTGALAGGISFLYKTEDYIGWSVGFNVFGTDSATATATNPDPALGDQYGRVYFQATELYFAAHYYWNIASRFNIHIGGGPAFYMASLDLEALGGADVQYGNSIYGAHGRSFGFKGSAGAELFLSDAISLKIAGGFRYAPIDRFKYFIEVQDSEDPNIDYKKGEIAYWPNTYDSFEVDLSGVFVEVGLRIYFDPVANWKSND